MADTKPGTMGECKYCDGVIIFENGGWNHVGGSPDCPVCAPYKNQTYGVFESVNGSVANGLERRVAELEEQHADRHAACLAHRACTGTEHDPNNGKLHGYCVVCGVPWPCDTANAFLLPAPAPCAGCEEKDARLEDAKKEHDSFGFIVRSQAGEIEELEARIKAAVDQVQRERTATGKHGPFEGRQVEDMLVGLKT